MPESITKLSKIGEFGLIKRLMSEHTDLLPRDITGAGDDCAVVPAGYFGGASGSNLVITTDLMVENRHFRRSYFSPYNTGWKLMAVNLSDIAAMGAEPLCAVISLQLRPDLEISFAEELYRGLLEIAKIYGVMVVGGDTSSGSEISLGLTMLGKVDGEPCRRSTAAAGDELWISGDLGAANLALRYLEKESGFELPDHKRSEILERFLKPEPRIELGRALHQGKLCSAMMDVSDGLLQDAGHIAEASNLTIEIDASLVPCSAADQLLSALTGGEDYELLFCCSAAQSGRLQALMESEDRRGSLPALTRIGRLMEPDSEGPLVKIKRPDGATVSSAEFLESVAGGLKGGYAHF